MSHVSQVGGRQDVWSLADVVTRLRRVLRASVRNVYSWERLPMAQVEILQRLADEPGLRISEVATRHRLAVNTVSNLIQQMVVAGLVERSRDVSDRRAVSISLTPSGSALLTQWLDANNQRLAEAMGALAQRDQRTITRAVPALLRLVEQLECDLDTSLAP